MIIFKDVDQFDRNTGEKIRSERIPDFEICDYTGKLIDDGQEPVRYRVDYGSIDQCYGDGHGEGWLYDYQKSLGVNEYDDATHRIDSYEFFGQTEYVFFTNHNGTDVFGEMIKEFLEQEEEEIYGLDHLLRWSRGAMLKKLIEAGTYKVEQFLED